jgi:hypothetical protein
MDAVAERDELRRLVEELPDDALGGALTDLRLRLAARGEWPPEFFSIGPSRSGRSDMAERTDELLAEGFGK